MAAIEPIAKRIATQYLMIRADDDQAGQHQSHSRIRRPGFWRIDVQSQAGGGDLV